MNDTPLALPPALARRLVVATCLGAVVLGASALFSPERVWANLLLASYYLVTLGLGGAVFIALTNICGAGWNVAFRRVPEAMTGLLPMAGVILLAVLSIRLPQYAWHHHGEGDAGTFWFKELWLEPKFFAARAVAYIVIWIAFAKIFVRASRRQDANGGSSQRINTGVSALFLAVFAITISLAGIDWIMALEPLWFSTMWGVYQFSGLMTGALAAMIVACVTLRKYGPPHQSRFRSSRFFRDEHLHDLGKLLLGFSCFWMYIWFSQYMLIWYANIPEETSYFIRRTHGPWGSVVISSLVLNWIIPLFVLLPRPCKRSDSVMLKVAVVVLIGRWVDLSVMIFPPVTGDIPLFGIPEIATIVCLGCVSGLLFVRSFSSATSVPRHDPCLTESLQYHA